MRSQQQGMSVEELKALPVTVEVWPTAGRALGIGRTTVYALVQAGEFPVPVRRVGNRYRVNRSDLLRALGEAEEERAS